MAGSRGREIAISLSGQDGSGQDDVGGIVSSEERLGVKQEKREKEEPDQDEKKPPPFQEGGNYGLGLAGFRWWIFGSRLGAAGHIREPRR